SVLLVLYFLKEFVMPTPNEPTPPKKPTNPSAKPPVGKPDGKAPPPKSEGKPDGKAPPKAEGKVDGKAPPPKAEGRADGKATAPSRVLLDENQLLQALAEQHGMKIVDMEDVKPTPEALQLVPETMATVYKCLPLTVKDKILTVILSDPSNPAALDDLRNFLGVKDVKALCAPPKIIEESIA